MLININTMRESILKTPNNIKSSELVQLVIDSAPMSVTLYDKNLVMFECNMEAVRLLEFSSKNEFITEFNERFFNYSAEYQPCGTLSTQKAETMFDIAADEGRNTFEWLHLTANGSELPTEATIVRIDYQDTYMLAAYVSDLRQIKQAMAEAQSAELAKESNRAKTEFLARMSHEIRTPITTILGISEIELQNSNLSPRIEESFAKIYNSSNALLNIINDILDLSKIEAGKMEVIQEEYETASMISDIVQIQIAFLGNKDGIEFSMQIDEKLPYKLVGDMFRIEQILTNLLSNAFKYTEKGSVTLSFKWENEELVASICDTGVGMSEEQLNNLYGEFSRFHERKMRSISGAGLGMPIVYKLVNLMDAQVDIKSKVGVGTEVTVRIPQKTSGTRVLGKDLSSSLQQFKMFITSPAKNFKFYPEPMPYGKVLVVDDMDANLYVAKGLLAFYDLNVETCTSGYKAVEKIKQGNCYDIIFLDQMMPGMDGIETLHIMRGLGYKNPIVALTANALIGQAEEFIKNGFDGFISKPIQTVHLNTILIKYIKDKQPQEVIAATSVMKSNSPKQKSIVDYQNDATLISKLRLDYAKNHRNLVTQLHKAINARDITTAHRTAHSIKGLAGLIQEPKLAELAAQVEYVLKDEQFPISKLLSKLEQEHIRVLESVDMPDLRELTNNKVLDKEKARILFNELAPLLKARNAGSRKFLDELRTIPESAILVKLIEDFEFEISYKILETLRTVLEV